MVWSVSLRTALVSPPSLVVPQPETTAFHPTYFCWVLVLGRQAGRMLSVKTTSDASFKIAMSLSIVLLL